MPRDISRKKKKKMTIWSLTLQKSCIRLKKKKKKKMVEYRRKYYKVRNNTLL